jgi:hypothetical protein
MTDSLVEVVIRDQRPHKDGPFEYAVEMGSPPRVGDYVYVGDVSERLRLRVDAVAWLTCAKPLVVVVDAS